MSATLRVLIVEDSEEDTALLLRELRRGGYDVSHQRVDTPAAMNSALVTGEWDIVVSDHTMPHFSGSGALKLLREMNLDLPFIFVSGTLGEETAVAALKSGAQDYLVKNNVARLIPAIQRELREVEQRRERRRLEQQFRRSEELYRHLVEDSPDAMPRLRDTLRRILGRRSSRKAAAGFCSP